MEAVQTLGTFENDKHSLVRIPKLPPLPYNQTFFKSQVSNRNKLLLLSTSTFNESMSYFMLWFHRRLVRKSEKTITKPKGIFYKNWSKTASLNNANFQKGKSVEIFSKVNVCKLVHNRNIMTFTFASRNI